MWWISWNPLDVVVTRYCGQITVRTQLIVPPLVDAYAYQAQHLVYGLGDRRGTASYPENNLCPPIKHNMWGHRTLRTAASRRGQPRDMYKKHPKNLSPIDSQIIFIALGSVLGRLKNST